MNVKSVKKKIRLSAKDLVRFQLITDLMFFKKETLTPSELEILTQLAMSDNAELSKFCNETVKKMYDIKEMEEFSVRSQNIRNIITKLEKRGFIAKSNGKGKKTISVHPDIEVFYKGNVLLEYDFLSLNEISQ